MLIIPAIDIKNGKCVRLTQGDFSKEKIYDENPVSVAKRFQQNGAEMLHVVDIDGAQRGTMKNKKVIQQIAQSIKIPIQVGGGIRSENTIDALLKIGVDRVVLGTLVVENPKLISSLLSSYRESVAIALDAKNEKLTSYGWQNDTEIDVLESAQCLEGLGAQTFIYTDVVRDGMLTSPNFEAIKSIRKHIQSTLIVGGGVSSISDIKKLKLLGVDGVIIGKAIYEKRVDLTEAIRMSS